MITSQKIIVIEKIEKPYDFQGKQGVSLAVRALVGIDVFRFKTTKAVLDTLEIEKPYTAEINIRTIKEDPVLEVVSAKKAV